MKNKIKSILKRASRKANKHSNKLVMLSEKQFSQLCSYLNTMVRKTETSKEEALVSECHSCPEIADDHIFFDYELDMLYEIAKR